MFDRGWLAFRNPNRHVAVPGVTTIALTIVVPILAGGCSFAENLANRDPSGVSSEASAEDSLGVPTVSENWGQPASVVRVIDGDSLELEVDGQSIEVRLPGLNAPELYTKDNDKTCQGLRAKEALEVAVEPGNIRFEPDTKDRFGRTLGQVSVDGRLLIELLIGQGWGLATGGDGLQRELMKAAANDGRGIWGDGCGQKDSTLLSIGETRVDAEGDDRSNVNGEWVEIANGGTEEIDLSGWTIRDETFGHRFPLTGRMQPGALLRIRSGNGTDTANEMYLGERYPVWSNSSETVVLVDPNGVFTDWAFID